MKTLHILLRLLTQKKDSIYLFILATITSVLGGACTSGLIALVHRTIQTETAAGTWTMFLFFLLLIGHAAFGILASYTSAKLSYGIILELRMNLSERILSASLKNIEDVGTSHLRTILTEVSDVVSRSIEDLPKLLTRVALLIGLYTYLAWLSPILFAILIIFLALGTVVYVLPTKIYQRYQKLIWQARHTHYKYLHTLVEGIKELLQNRARKNALLHDYLRPSGNKFVNLKIRSVLLDSGIERWGELYAMLGLAFILFLLPQWGWATYQEVGAFLFILLFTLGPMTTLISFFFRIQDMNAALHQLETVGMRLDQTKNIYGHHNEAENQKITELVNGHLSLQFQDVSYTYNHSELGEQFTLGPLSFNLKKPEILFITGGNGSGKSTMAKLLCGLYAPESGCVILNGKPISEHNREAYRQLFAVVFFDFFLFDVLLGLKRNDLDQAAGAYLKKLRLAQKVSVRDGVFSTTRLSQGQRKRLALLQAYLEDRDIYVFDEWAADQDAAFKAIFYGELIPALKRKGKIVVVISHDDSYFHMADQVIKLVDGQSVELLEGMIRH